MFVSKSPELKASTRPADRPASSRYSYRRLAMAELPLLNELYNTCYRANRPLEEADWLYRKNPNGEAIIMAAFDDDNELAGVRPAIPWKFVWRDEERTAYEFADALVAPRHRNRGIFTHLVKLTCEVAEQNDFTLFSIPNDHSLPVYQRTGHLRVLGACETRVKPISWPRYIGHRIGLHGHDSPRSPAEQWAASLGDGDVSLRAVNRFESDFQEIHSEFAAVVASFTLRRKEFLQWRYFGSPVRQYRVALVEQGGHIRGYLVIRMIEGIAHLIDVFLTPDMRIARKAFRLAIAWAKQMGAIAIHFNASKDNFFHPVAARCGFWLKKKSGRLVLDRKSAQLLASRRNGRLAIQDVYFVMGDFDFF